MIVTRPAGWLVKIEFVIRCTKRKKFALDTGLLDLNWLAIDKKFNGTVIG